MVSSRDVEILKSHKMEQRASVYLVLNHDGKWQLDNVFLQAGPVDGLDIADDQGCPCDAYDTDDHQRALEIANNIEMPTAVELLRAMLAAMFPHDAPPDLTDRTTIEAWLDDPKRRGPVIL